VKTIAQLQENGVTSSMQRIRALFEKHLPNGRLLIEPAYLKPNRKEPKHTPKLGDETIKAIRKELATGESPRRIAKRYGISDMLCYNIKNRRGRFA